MVDMLELERDDALKRAEKAEAALANLVERNATVSGETVLLSFGSHGEALTALRKARDCLSRRSK